MDKSASNQFWTSATRIDDSERLFAAAEALEGLTAHPGWEILTQLVRQSVEGQNAYLRSKVHDHTEYVRWTAIGHGAGLVLGLPRTVQGAAARKREELEREVANA